MNFGEENSDRRRINHLTFGQNNSILAVRLLDLMKYKKSIDRSKTKVPSEWLIGGNEEPPHKKDENRKVKVKTKGGKGGVFDLKENLKRPENIDFN